jgi:hypothetical protein
MDEDGLCAMRRAGLKDENNPLPRKNRDLVIIRALVGRVAKQQAPLAVHLQNTVFYEVLGPGFIVCDHCEDALLDRSQHRGMPRLNAEEPHRARHLDGCDVAGKNLPFRRQ